LGCELTPVELHRQFKPFVYLNGPVPLWKTRPDGQNDAKHDTKTKAPLWARPLLPQPTTLFLFGASTGSYAYATLPLARALVFLILLTLLAGLVLTLLLLAGLLAAALLLLTGLAILLIWVLVLLLHAADSLPVERRINVHSSDWLPERPVPSGQRYGKVVSAAGRSGTSLAVESGI
jgi:hypothetical protein